MHIRYAHAAVAAMDEGDATSPLVGAIQKVPSPLAPISGRIQTLWASKPLEVGAGRLIGVRLRGTLVDVALVRQSADGLRWVPASSVLSEYQAQLWVATALFRP